MELLADTSAWSRFYRGDIPADDPIASVLETELPHLRVATIGLIYSELLRGFTQPASRATIENDFASIPFLEPTRADYAAAADIAVTSRRAGIQLTTIDALIAQICIANNLSLLTADADFLYAARHVPLSVCNPA